MREKNETFGFKADNHVKFRIPWNIAKDSARCVLTKDELRYIQEKSLEKCRRGFVSKYYPVVGSSYSIEDLENIAYVFYQATINRYNPSKVKDKRLKYKRPEKGLFGKYPKKRLEEVEKAKKKLISWFEVFYFRYINSFLGEVKQEAALRGSGAYNYSDDFIDRRLDALKPETITRRQAILRTALVDIKKYAAFKRFLIQLSARETPLILKNKYKDAYPLYIQLADDLQYEISQATSEEEWNNDVYFEGVAPYNAPEYSLYVGSKKIPLEVLRETYHGSVVELEEKMKAKAVFKVDGKAVSKIEGRNFALIELIETVKIQLEKVKGEM